ncbi:hypothetical protein Snoj_37250 [Streptomyces nojiriensis]|uniref:DUF1838 domain-containing protein n=1 Tax=Streptomyces nojiriensis TaxID=66374 RepID=A0ABQ3SNU5_9ACTN|nr:DUF1838 family protein [Streptomyces nojiriensis]QTI43356.1 hypothetical protein JYK04_01118 [Streptomyces nojiriensis]GGS12319.1 hypothetical protein GCM10010205_47620 [Streptomyces nojiriensis]GHI69807.1 hypothetical protein Snoj_37250 [Streptomyces nojiriensis]
MTTELTPAELLQAFARTRASLDGAEVTYRWTGDVHSWAPGEPYRRVFGFEGLNVARLVADEELGGYQLLSREAAFYLDPVTREILETWQDKPVVHVWNDPANQKWRPFPVPLTELGDQVCFSLEIPLAYPSPLPVAEYPAQSADDTYRALELFQFFAPAATLTTDAVSVPATMSWTRMSPWLPWMEQGQRPGGLTFHCRGRKLDSYAQVPERTRAYIAEKQPEFAHAPEKWSEPNETSWTYFRKLFPPR